MLGNPIRAEPALFVGFIMAIVTVAIAFGAPITPEQKQALNDNLLTLVIGIFVMAGVIRQLVYAPDTVKDVAAKNVQIGYVAGLENSPVPPATIVPPPPGDAIKKAA